MKIRELNEKATPIPASLDHKNTAIAGPTINGDWDWIIKPLETQDLEMMSQQEIERHRNNCLLHCILHNSLPALIALVEAAQRACIKSGLHDEHPLRVAIANLPEGWK